MSNNIAKQQYEKFYQSYNDVKISSFKICDRKLESSEDYAYLISHYNDSSIVLGIDKIYVTYRYPTQDYKIGFSFPARLVFQDEIEQYEIDEMNINVFKI